MFFLSCGAGKQIERDPSIDRLIEIRTVLEKIRPIDYKLRYQIDKLVKTAITGVTNAKDPINFKVTSRSLQNSQLSQIKIETKFILIYFICSQI